MALTKVTQHSLGNSAVTTAKLNLAAPLGFANSSANVLYMAANGNVGIGNSAPTNGKLVITGSGVTTSQGIRLTGDTADARFICESATIGAGILGTFSEHSQLFYTNSTEKMRIAANGNIGIGTSSPDTGLSLRSVASTSDSTRFNILALDSSAYAAGVGGGINFGFIWNSNGDPMGRAANIKGIKENSNNNDYASALVFSTTQNSASTTERMRIDSEGYFLMAPTYRTVPRGRVDISAPGNSVGGLPTVCLAMSRWGDAGPMVNFFGTHESTSSIGNITNAGNTNTQYNTSSDYRLKQNITPMTGALAKVALLKPCTYTWKATGAAGQGFIAHELQAVVPDAVCGEKDAVNGDGSIQSQGVDTSYLVATLTAAIQELKAEFDAYKASHP